MNCIHTIPDVRAASRAARRGGARIGLVPTMGALHEGHLSLVARARAECDHVIVSVFVNPLQFGPGEDLEAYPRTLAEDCRLCERAGADVVFAPSAAEMYPGGTVLTTVSVRELTDGLCGAHRPGHFDGVTTVVAKLFATCEPDCAYFGEKDWQQLRVVERMVADLSIPCEIVRCAIVREADGLAMSSRNRYLPPEERRQALALSRALFAMREACQGGERSAAALRRLAERALAEAPLGTRDYLEIVDAETLLPLERLEPPARALVAVRFPSARLIDNVALL